MQRTSAELRQARAPAYENPRPEVQALVPRGANRILDVGCASGALGAALKARQSCEVTGVELDRDYARDAAAHLDRVLVADLETFEPAAEQLGGFDCLIAADVLEHLRDPWAVLERLAGAVRPGGSVIVSVPNVRHWTTFRALGWWGIWPRDDHGVYDRSHLRWFTLADVRALMEQAGLQVTTVTSRYRLRLGDPDSEPSGRRFARTPLAPFFAFQYILAGVRTGS
ncbi:MAG: class I SAM-dependent methyltransferase [Solirubrobacteraceae bacterium]